MKKITLETRITLGFTVSCLIAFVTILIEFIKNRNLVNASGGSSSLSYAIILIPLLLMIVLDVFIILSTRKTLRKHTDNLNTYSGKIALGETDFKVEAPSQDEFMPVYDALNSIVENNRELADITETIAAGDLTVNVKPRSEKDILGNSLMHLVKKDKEMISGIKESSYQLSTGAEQVAAASQALAQGSTEQASAVEEITVSMKNIENMTNENATEAGKATDLVNNTKNAATVSSERMGQMKAAMDEINEASEKINKIIKVIDDISFQTNILALNAAVEAARAGEHGKGFAVVAEQIRELAAKSAAAAAETADMIDDSIRKVHRGTELADETEKALNEMVEDIDKVVLITGAINDSSNEQAKAISQVDQAIEQVSMVVQNNSATSEECAAASEELSSQSQSLRDNISLFKLNGPYEKKERVEKEAKTHKRNTKAEMRTEEDPESIISLDGDFGKY